MGALWFSSFCFYESTNTMDEVSINADDTTKELLVKIMKQSPYRRTEEELEALLHDNKDVDITDVKILSILQMDGRASFNTLAHELNLSVATVSKRVAKLERLGVIKGFSAVVACEGLGFTENLWVMLYLEPGADAGGIGEEVAKLRGVKCVYQIFSDFDLLVHICCATNSDIDNAIKTIGKIEGVSKVTKMSVYKKIKEDFRVQI
jgi:DNA-binding Lrp family transcriptional regulator